MSEAPALKVTCHLRSYELRQPRTHVVAGDLAAVVGLRHWGRAELLQRRRATGYTPTAIALLMLLRTVHGLKGGRLGCGAQLSPEEFAVRLGCSVSAFHNARRETEDAGLIARFKQRLPVALLTARRKGGPAQVLRAFHLKGTVKRLHHKADAVAVTYLTPAGCSVVDATGRTRAFLRVPDSSGRMQRQAVSTGLMRRLWKTLRHELSAVWHRVAAVKKKLHPKRSEKKRHSSTTSCSRAPKLWETPPAAADGGEALAGHAHFQSDFEAQGPPSVAGTQACAPTGSAEPGHHSPPPHTSRPGGGEVACPPVPESLVAALPEALRETFRRCWQRTVRVTTYRQRNRRFAGGDALVPSGTREVWAPAVTAATAAPARWGRADAVQRRLMERDFQPVRQVLTVAVLELERQRAAALEAAAAEAARSASEHEQLLAEVEALERRRRQQPGAGAW